MFDIELVKAIADIAYPFVVLFVYWKLHRRQKKIERQQNVIQSMIGDNTMKVNGRLDELIAAKEDVARRKGIEEGLALALKSKGDI